MAASEKVKKRPKPAVGLSFSDEDAGGPVLFKKRKKSIASREAAADVARELGEKGRGKGAEEYTGYGLSALKRANEAARERTKRVARSIEDEREQAERDAAAADALRRREEQRQAADAAIVYITATSSHPQRKRAG
ncbi:hypothetical protein DIPPA_28441 [Diplonema papillatum]|nr:hypothetical protein DIPPA_28441 [Diplonema papillatum]